MFLHYILQEHEESLLFSFLLAQMEDPKDGDWWLTVKNEMEELKLDVTLSEIKQMSKKTFKNKVKTSVSREAFKWLSLNKTELKKVKNIEHVQHDIQKYLSSSILSVEQAQFLFHLRTKMLFLRNNYRNMQKEEFCSAQPKGER